MRLLPGGKLRMGLLWIGEAGLASYGLTLEAIPLISSALRLIGLEYARLVLRYLAERLGVNMIGCFIGPQKPLSVLAPYSVLVAENACISSCRSPWLVGQSLPQS